MKIFNRNFFFGVGTGVLITILIIVVAGYLFVWWYSSNTTQKGEEILERSLEAPPFPSAVLADYNWTIQSLKGQDVKMADAKGKVVFLNFWATWCSPCIAEMPSIQRLHERLKNEGVVFLCISDEETTKVSRFARERGFTFPIYTMHGPPPAAFRSRGIPATFILSPDGKIAFKHVGSAKWDDEKSIAFIKSLMK